MPRRLPVIALEDIGLGDLAVCSEVVKVFGRQHLPKVSRFLLTAHSCVVKRSLEERFFLTSVCFAAQLLHVERVNIHDWQVGALGGRHAGRFTHRKTGRHNPDAALNQLFR